jgi:hypothetical protein
MINRKISGVLRKEQFVVCFPGGAETCELGLD